MEEIQILKHALKAFAGLDEDAFNLSLPFWHCKEYQKGDYYNEYKSVCKYLGFITTGIFRSFNSISPYQLGVGTGKIAVKYCAKPVSAVTDAMPQNAPDDFLRKAMQNTLNNGDVFYKFYVQPKTSDNMSVEDYTVEWDEQQAPFYEVATIRIPRQYFQTAELDSLGENLSFNPWHTLPEHRPLGCLNRVRKIVYERISRVRREMNKVPVQEP
jgi:hypothetical protein